MTQTVAVGEPGPGSYEPAQATGRLRSAVRATRRLHRIARLERELAAVELRRKGARAGAGAALGASVAVLVPYAIGLALAAMVAALALAVAVWLALLIALGFVLAVIVVLGLFSRRLVGGARPFRPEHALEEVQLLREAVRSANGR